MAKTARKKLKILSELKSLIALLTVILVLTLAFANLRAYFTPKMILGLGTEVKREEEKVFWEDFLKKNPTYIDGWIELAQILNEQLDKEGALKAINAAKNIDPNSKKIEEFIKDAGFSSKESSFSFP